MPRHPEWSLKFWQLLLEKRSVYFLMIWTISVICMSKIFYSLPPFGSVSCMVPWVRHCLFMYVLILNILAKVRLLNFYNIFYSFRNATIGKGCWKTYCSIPHVIINKSEATESYITSPGRWGNSTLALIDHLISRSTESTNLTTELQLFVYCRCSRKD